MKIQTEILSSATAFNRLNPEWNSLVSEDSSGLLGLDGTSTHEWFETVLRVFPETVESHVVVARHGIEVVGILPLVINRVGRFGPRLVAATEVYSGRNGPLLKAQSAEVMSALLRGMDTVCPGWVSLNLELVANSANAQAVLCAGRENGYSVIMGPGRESPFFPLCETNATFTSGVSKSLRQKMKVSKNKFAAIGTLKFLDYVQENQAEELLEMVLSVERNSWKHDAGSAITTQPRQQAFYRALFPRAMMAGLLRAEVLTLQDDPIAYHFGLTRQRVFSSLKHSSVSKYDKLSPSYLLNESLFGKLRDQGVVTVDWMGVTVPHKLQWSDNNGYYNCHSYTVFNRTLKARSVELMQRQRQRLADLQGYFHPSNWASLHA